jgi:triosephosphate isomerase
MPKLLALNWKENPKTQADALRLLRSTLEVANEKTDLVICPPFIYIEKLAEVFKHSRKRQNIALGAQDIFWEEWGPYTSEVGPRMLKSLDVRYTIIGHSERRKWLHETDVMINKKIKLAFRDKLKIILCVGEPLSIRKKGSAAAKRFVKAQLTKDLLGLPKLRVRSAGIIIAYEPIWAIGTGRSAKPRDAADMAAFIKEFIARHFGSKNVKVLYGGSVNGANIADFVQLKEIDGALVGGAGLKPDEVKKMIKKL